jgi:acyl-coenzyme A thioesterase PaaI-like protein
VRPERLVHHELCFGCGRTNLFGLQMELEAVAEGHVRGRAFVKQDHQGPARGSAHEAILLAALGEAMGFACGPDMRAVRLELKLEAPAPVGAFLDLQARAGDPADDGFTATATARVEDRTVARANGVYAPG